jgi:hypothetical protein
MDDAEAKGCAPGGTAFNASQGRFPLTSSYFVQNKLEYIHDYGFESKI